MTFVNEVTDGVHCGCCLSAKQPSSYIINNSWNVNTGSVTEKWLIRKHWHILLLQSCSPFVLCGKLWSSRSRSREIISTRLSWARAPAISLDFLSKILCGHAVSAPLGWPDMNHTCSSAAWLCESQRNPLFERTGLPKKDALKRLREFCLGLFPPLHFRSWTLNIEGWQKWASSCHQM